MPRQKYLKIPVVGMVVNGLTTTGKHTRKLISGRLRPFWEFTCPSGCKKFLCVGPVYRGETSCGCSKRSKPTQEKYGMLTPTGKMEKRPKPNADLPPRGYTNFKSAMQTYWECVCDCGTTCIFLNDYIRNGSRKSCGCLTRYHNKSLPATNRKSPGLSALNRLYHQYKRAAKQRDYAWNLGREEFAIITKKNCFYCGIEPLQSILPQQGQIKTPYIYNGVDRLDNNVGYMTTNAVPSCGTCNVMKRVLGYQEFLDHISRIYNHSVKL